MKRFKDILYVSECAVAQGDTIARAVSLAQNNQAQLTVIDVIPVQTAGIGMPPGGPIAADLTAAMISERRQQLDSLVAPYTARVGLTIEVLVGIRFIEVIRGVLRKNFDLVIKPAENPDWIKRLFGSDDMHLLRKCPCPVWLMKSHEKSNYERIVAAVDFDPNATDSDSDQQLLTQEILGLASSLALSDFAELHIVHAWDTPYTDFMSLWADNPKVTEMTLIEAERIRHKSGMDKLTRELRERLGAEAYGYLSPRVHMPRDAAHKAIPALVEELNTDLVVMGTVARTGIPGFIIGNTAEAIVDQLSCSVLALKPPGFVSPVTLT